MALTARPSAASRAIVIALLLVGLVLLVVGVAYLALPASSLPSVLPGHAAHYNHHGVKRGSATVAVAVLCLVGAWFVARRSARIATR
jgi:amino acid permease